MSATERKPVVLSYIGPVDDVGVRRICKAFNMVVNAGQQDVTFLFGSDGGVPASAFFLHNYLSALPIQIAVHNMGLVASAAVTVFLAGHRRTCSELATFMIHPTTYGPVPEAMPASVLYAKLTSLMEIENQTHTILKTKTTLSDKLLDKRFDGEVLISPDIALSGGLVHHVCEFQSPTNHEIFQI